VTTAEGLPVLSDGVVTLRGSEPRDGAAIEAGMHDPDVVRWIGAPRPSAEAVLAENDERWADGSPTLSICELDGTCVGLVWMNRRASDAATGSVGYWLLPAARGRGLATRAVRLLSTWVTSELGITTLRLTTAPDNHRSQRVAERSGFRRLGVAADVAPEPRERGQVVFELPGAPGTPA
jgi:RimJ/RimL family protein N-acetyltransferase